MDALPLTGRVVLVTGDVEGLSREEAQEGVVGLGGSVVASVTKSCDLVVHGVKAGASKMAKARASGIALLDEAAFRALLEAPEEWDGTPVGVRDVQAAQSAAVSESASFQADSSSPQAPELDREQLKQLLAQTAPHPVWQEGDSHRVAQSSFTRKGRWTVTNRCRCRWYSEHSSRLEAEAAAAAHVEDADAGPGETSPTSAETARS